MQIDEMTAWLEQVWKAAEEAEGYKFSGRKDVPSQLRSCTAGPRITS